MVIEPSLPERCLRAGGCKKSGVAEEKHASDKDMYFLTSPGAFGSVWREPKIRKISGGNSLVVQWLSQENKIPCDATPKKKKKSCGDTELKEIK